MKSDINKTIKTEKRQGAGRPRKEIDLEILGNLASIGCTWLHTRRNRFCHGNLC
jgi:hypothetical protein